LAPPPRADEERLQPLTHPQPQCPRRGPGRPQTHRQRKHHASKTSPVKLQDQTHEDDQGRRPQDACLAWYQTTREPEVSRQDSRRSRGRPVARCLSRRIADPIEWEGGPLLPSEERKTQGPHRKLPPEDRLSPGLGPNETKHQAPRKQAPLPLPPPPPHPS